MSGRTRKDTDDTTGKDSAASAIGAYKKMLREIIDRRPSGLRQKIAQALGTHKSFVSQITNPADPTPLPQKHIEAIMRTCHFTGTERDEFLQAYEVAHEGGRQRRSARRTAPSTRSFTIDLPDLNSETKQKEVEGLMKLIAERLATILS